ncbi:MAG: FGGY family carbohydrate kinase [Christensenella sp.]|nr:FGGY family carbohydrate kinase [Christensenella sp.]
MEKYIVGIDVGTTGTKTVVFDTKGNEISKAYIEYGSVYPKPGWVEQDAALILDATLDACRQAVGKLQAAEELVCVSVSTQRACAIFLDADEKPMKMFSWQDARPEKEAEFIRSKISEQEFYQITGVPNNPAWILPKVMWIQKHEPEVWERTHKVVQLEDYILRALGADDYYVSETNAGFYCVWDADNHKWSQKMVDLFHVDTSMFSRPMESGKTIGEVSRAAGERTGLPAGLPVIMGAGDQTCACIGAGVVRPGALSVSMGTGGMCLAFLDRPYRDPKGSFMVVNHAVPGAFELEGWQKGSAGIFRWFRDEIATQEHEIARREGKDVYVLLNELIAQSPAGAKGLIMLPYFATAGTPRWNDNARGTFFGLTYAHDRSCMARAVIEGITMEHKDMMQSLKKSGVPIERVCIIGGPTKSDLWNQVQADMYGVPVEKPVVEDASIIGCAIIGAVGAGLYGNIPEATQQFVRIDRRYEPDNKNMQRYEELYGIYDMLYRGIEASGAFDAIAEYQNRQL